MPVAGLDGGSLLNISTAPSEELARRETRQRAFEDALCAQQAPFCVLVVASSPEGKTWPLVSGEVLDGISERCEIPVADINVSFCQSTADNPQYRGSFPSDIALGRTFNVIVFAGLCNTEHIPLLESLVPHLESRDGMVSSVLFIECQKWVQVHVERNQYANLFSDARALRPVQLEAWHAAAGDTQYLSVSPWLYAYEVCRERGDGDNYDHVAPFAVTTMEYAQGNLLFYDLTQDAITLLRTRVEVAHSGVPFDTHAWLGIDAGGVTPFSPHVLTMLLRLPLDSSASPKRNEVHTQDLSTPAEGSGSTQPLAGTSEVASCVMKSSATSDTESPVAITSDNSLRRYDPS